MELAEPKPIREYERVDQRVFEDRIRPAGQPAVLRGLADDWPAVSAARISDEEFVAYVKARSAGKRVTAIVGQPDIDGRFLYTDDLRGFNFERGVCALEPFLD